MELHAISGMLAMFERHDLAFGRLRDDLSSAGTGS